jgi:hypothetical protein
MPVRAADDDKTEEEEKYGIPPLVPAVAMFSVPVVVTGLPEIEKMPEDDPPFTVWATLVTVPVPAGQNDQDPPT